MSIQDSDLEVCQKCLSLTFFCLSSMCLFFLSSYIINNVINYNEWKIFLIGSVSAIIFNFFFFICIIKFCCFYCESPIIFLEKFCCLCCCFNKNAKKLLIFFLFFLLVILIPWIIFVVLYTIKGPETAVIIAGIIAAIIAFIMLLCLVVPKIKISQDIKPIKKTSIKIDSLEKGVK